MKYLFLDTETTGLSPKTDKVLEIAWAFTDSAFEVIGTPKTFLIEQENWQDTWHVIKNNEFVMNMHSESNLIEDLTSGHYELSTLDRVWISLITESREVRSHGEFVHLAGLSVHFDKAFLDANEFHSLWGGEDLVSPIHHRILDLSSFKLLVESAGLDPSGMTPDNGTRHRALSDVFESIGFARNARSFLQTAGVYA